MFLIVSCDPSLLNQDWVPNDGDQGRRLSIRLTDEPINAEEVNVDIQSIIIKTNEGFDSVALETAAGIYNLLDYQDGVDTLIGNVIIDFENIKEIRLILGENNSIKVDGVLYPLIIPSGGQTGLKIKVNIDVTNSELVEILIDFDALKSIVKKGNGTYHLKPVLKIKKIIKDGEIDIENEDGTDDENEFQEDVDCTRGKGYWKTHSLEGPAALDSSWLEIENVDDFFGTGKSYYQYLSESSGNDLFAKLAIQYIVAELNVLAGVEIPTEALDAWNAAAELIANSAVDQVIGSSDEEKAKDLIDILDDFNSGELGPLSCDDDEEDEDEEDDEDDENEVDGDVECTRGKGYWKTHSLEGPAALDSSWLEIENVDDFFTTGKSYYQYLSEPSGNNLFAKLAIEYIVAELNVIAGAEIPAEALDAWNEAAELIANSAVDQVVKASDEEKAKDLIKILKEFNSGELGPVSCDDDEEDEEDEEEEVDDENEGLTETMINTINELFPGADVGGVKEIKLCDGTEVLELKINYNSDNIYLIFDVSGDTFISYYVKGSEDDLPESVTGKLDSDFDGFKIKKVTVWTTASGDVSYEVEIQKMSDKKTLTFDSNGNIVCD